MNKVIKLYHGGPSAVRIPDFSMGREDIDFGRGFYLTDNFERSAKWACRRASSIVNEYELSLDGLKIHRFSADEEWLDFVVANRHQEELSGKHAEFASCDVLIGPIADDRLFSLIELYEDGIVPANVAAEVMNCMDYGIQFTLKTDRAIRNLLYKGHVRIIGEEREQYKRLFAQEAKEAGRRTQALLKEKNQGRQ